MKKIKLYLIFAALINAAFAFSQSTTRSYTSTLNFLNSDFLQEYEGLRIAVPTMTLPNSLNTYTSTLNFLNTDNRQVYNAIRGVGDAISSLTASIPTSTNFWGITGNAISTNTNFIGSTSNYDWLIKSNNKTRFKIGSTGINTIYADSSSFDMPFRIEGGSSINGTNPYMQLKGYYIGAYRILNTTTGIEWYAQNQTIAGNDLDCYSIGISNNPSSGFLKIQKTGVATFSSNIQQNGIGTGNTVFGTTAQTTAITNGSNTVMGWNASKSNPTGVVNSIFGCAAASSASFNAGSNSLFGYNTGRDLTSGGNNTYIGESAGRGNKRGSGNVALGKAALLNDTLGAGNIAIGLNAGRYGVSFHNRLFINGIDRTTAALDSTSSIIYGYQNSSVASQTLYFNSNVKITGKSFFGGNSTAPTALIHLAAGTTAASTAPLKFTSGSLLTTAEAGAIEFLTDKAYLTITTGAARKEVTLNDAALTSGRVPFATTNGRLTDLAAFTYATNRLSPTYMTLGAGAAAAGSAPLVFTTGTNLTTAIAGAMEFSSNVLYFTPSGTNRYQVGVVLSATGVLDFVNTAAQTSSELTITVTGAAVGDAVSVGLPAAPNANSAITGYVSAANTVTLRFNNYSAAAIDPASATYKATVIKN